MSQSTRLLAYGRTSADHLGEIRSYSAPWEEIRELFREPARRKVTSAQYAEMTPKQRAASKNAGLFFGGLCAAGKRRSTSLIHRDILNFDLDEHCESIWQELLDTGRIAALDGLGYLVHTTRSHTDAHPKLRILLPTSKPVMPGEYGPVVRAGAFQLDPRMLAVAGESFVPAQGMFFPTTNADQEYRLWIVDGAPFDVDAALAKYPADQPTTWPARPREKVQAYSAERRMTHPEDKKAQAPVIAAVHRAFGPYGVLDQILDDIYAPAGDRYTIIGATGAPSVRVYDDAFIHSDHGSDKAVGQHNAFDLVRIHRFGELDADFDLASLSPSDWPSYRACCVFMLGFPEVRAHLKDIEAEIAAERHQGLLDALGGLDDLDDEEDGDPAGDDDDDDLIGDDDDDDLIGDSEPAQATVEMVIARVRRALARAVDIADLERRLEVIRAFPLTEFRNLHRDLVTPDVVRRFDELGAPVSKAAARRLLVPSIENLRDQAASRPMPDWLQGWVYLAGDTKYMHMDTKEMLSRDGFNGRFNRAAGEEAGVSDLGVTKVQASDLATQVFCIPMPHSTRFHPGKPPLFVEDGITYANTYRAPIIESGGYKGRRGVELLLRLIEELLPAKVHQEILLDFMAHCVRFPHRKLRYALLLKGSENEGKSLIANLLRVLVGRRNSGIVGPDQLTERFNSWSHEKNLVIVEEVKMYGRESHEVLNRLKPTITNDEIAIRRMQRDVTTEPNFCNVMLTTNYEDCLPVAEDNTRFAVLFTRFLTNQAVIEWREARIQAEGSDYVRELFDHIQNHPLQFAEFFDGYEFSSQYDPGGRAPWTTFKAVMAEDAKTEERQLLEDMLASGEHPGISDDILLWGSFRAELDVRGLAPALRGGGVSRFLKPMGFVKAHGSSCRVGGSVRRLNVWTRNTALLDADGSLTDLGKQRAIQAAKACDEVDRLGGVASG